MVPYIEFVAGCRDFRRRGYGMGVVTLLFLRGCLGRADRGWEDEE